MTERRWDTKNNLTGVPGCAVHGMGSGSCHPTCGLWVVRLTKGLLAGSNGISSSQETVMSTTHDNVGNRLEIVRRIVEVWRGTTWTWYSDVTLSRRTIVGREIPKCCRRAKVA